MKRVLNLCLDAVFLFLLCFYISISVTSPPHDPPHSRNGTDGCTKVHNFADYSSKCAFVQSQEACSAKGYVNYLEIFYCNSWNSPVLGYALLLLWLLVLFYLLGNTAAEYFCPSVESLSRVLKLSPTIAGTTLLPLGNGANDVFSSVISFTRSSDGDVGISSVLGGAFFISCFVVGIICILIPANHSKLALIDKPSFIRDVIFLLFSLVSLLIIIMFGRINLWAAIAFVSIYFLYIGMVSFMHCYYSKEGSSVDNPVPVAMTDNLDELSLPLLGEEKCVSSEKGWFGNSNLKTGARGSFRCFRLFLCVMEIPLNLPRKLTIPVVSEEKWSKPFAVFSSVSAPIVLAALWNTQSKGIGSGTGMIIYISACFLGGILGILTCMLTKKSCPPRRSLLPWVLGGFLMSIVWTYILAEELVSLLISFGEILGISPSILGLTVLAWGNSVGDLISNGTMALKGGQGGAQTAISGCYAGPLFNTLIGLGLSFVMVSWAEYPSSYVIPRDPYLYEIVGFLIGGLLWALAMLPKRNMRLDRLIGGGLLAIYFCFIFLSLARALGFP